ncbi:MAG: B12-binding domain-containing radical SAM protein [Candidatus Brocadiales bacterium]
MPPRGAVSVATAVAQTGRFRVEIIDENNFTGGLDHRVIQQETPADFVGLYGGLTSTIPRVYQVASFYQSEGIPTIAGGNHINAMAEEALTSGIDIVVNGEGEFAVPEVLDALSNGDDLSAIPGLSLMKDGCVAATQMRLPIKDLDTVPIPDMSLFRDLQTPMQFVPLGRTRGCNFVCEFCAVNQHLGRTRSSSPGYVMEEIAKSVEGGDRVFFVTDDNFAEDRDRTAELCEYIAEYKRKKREKLYFVVQVRADVARDKKLLGLMRAADVEGLCIGYESPIEEDLKNMKKGLNIKKLDEYTQTLKSYGFFIHGMFILGYPTFQDSYHKLGMSIRERANKFWEFINRNKIDTVQIVKPVPLPGTILSKKLKEENRLFPLGVVDYSKYDGNWLCFEPDAGIDPRELMYETERLLRRFYSFGSLSKLFYQVPLYPMELTYRVLSGLLPRLTNPTERDNIRSLNAFIRKSFEEGKREADRKFRNARLRLGGRIIFEKWKRDFRKEGFLDTVENARAFIKKHAAEMADTSAVIKCAE